MKKNTKYSYYLVSETKIEGPFQTRRFVRWVKEPDEKIIQHKTVNGKVSVRVVR